MKILITGTAGFIGFHLASRLIQTDDEVIGLDNINDYYDQSIKYGRLFETGILEKEIVYNKLVKSFKHNNYKFIKLNLEDKENLKNLFSNEKIDVVCNLAAQAGVRYSLTNPDVYIQSNIVGFLNILEMCRHFNIKHLVYASSSSVYGLNRTLPFSTNDNVDHPISLYAASKKSNELMAHTYSYLFSLPTTGLRFFTVYGPWGRPDMALFLFTKGIIENNPIKVFNNGEMLRDFTYIDDIVEGLVRVIQHPPLAQETWNGKEPSPSSSKAPYKIYNIGNNSPVKLMDFIEEIEILLEKKAIIEFQGLQMGDVIETFADVSDLEKELSYKPSTPLKTGVKHFINWYFNFYKI